MSRGSLLPLMPNRIHYSLNMRRIANYCRADGVGLRTPLLSFFFPSFFLSFAGETPTRNCDRYYTRPRRDTLVFGTEQQSMAYRRKLSSERPPKCRNVKCRLKKTPWGPFELPTRKRIRYYIWIDGCTNYKADSCKCDLTVNERSVNALAHNYEYECFSPLPCTTFYSLTIMRTSNMSE